MIEKAVVTYLNNHPSLVAYRNKFYYSRVPTDVKMPWVVVSNSGGTRPKVSANKKEPFDTLMIYIEGQKQFETYDLAYAVNDALDNYRGEMGNERDLLVSCDTPRDLNGFFQTYRMMLTVHVKYIQTFVTNRH